MIPRVLFFRRLDPEMKGMFFTNSHLLFAVYLLHLFHQYLVCSETVEEVNKYQADLSPTTVDSHPSAAPASQPRDLW
jgi:hypothetical protein